MSGVPPAEFAAAKINLYLRVLGRRRDSYHELDSLVAFADVGDRLRFAPGGDWALRCKGPFAASLHTGADNLVLKAARLYERAADGVATGTFVLEKKLPVASGLGGGSADAAATLRLLDRHNEHRCADKLAQLAAQLGSDVPVCLLGKAAMISGRGETIRPVALPPLAAVMVNPGTAVATADIFSALAAPALAARPGCQPAATFPGDPLALIAQPATASNDLEMPARRLAPAIAVCLDALKNTQDCLLARMSGSGATVFGLYADKASAQTAASALELARPDWWVKSAVLR